MRRFASVGLLILTLTCGAVTAPSRVVLAQGGGGFSPAGPPPLPPPAGSRIPSRGTGAISGIVVDSIGGQPIANVLVVVGQGASVRRQLTDAHGRFVVRDLPVGAGYTISASRSGYFDTRYGAKAARQGKTISLADGQWVKDVRIEMVKPGAIAGAVVDERGEPVVGAFVRVLAQMLVAGRPHLVSGPATRTDDRGAYRIGGLPQGTFFVMVPSVQNAVPSDTPTYTVAGQTAQFAASAQALGRPAPDYAALDDEAGGRLVIGSYPTPPASGPGARRQAYPMHFYPSARLIADATPIVLGPGIQRESVDLQLQPVPTWRVAGRLEAPAGALDGMVLRLVPPGLEELGFGSEAATTLVGPNGQFTFLDVPSGRYVIDARGSVMEFRYQDSGFANLPSFPTPGVSGGGGGGTLFSGPDNTSYAYTTSSGAATLWAREPVDVGAVDQTNVVVTMRRAVSLKGTVVTEPPAAPTAAAPPSAAIPPPPVFINAEPAGGEASLGLPTTSASGSGGLIRTFDLEGLLPGKYVLRVLGSGSPKSIVWAGKDYTFKPFDASAGQDFTDVVITMGSTQSGGTLSGVVSNIQTFPNGTSVIVFPAEPEQWTDYGFQPARLFSIAVDNSGRYSSGTRPPGDYNVIAVDASQGDRWKDPTFLAAAARLATPVTLSPGEAKTVTLQAVEVK